MKKKIWVITGISSGLGKALAESVRSRGEYAIGTFRKESQVEAFNNQKLENGHAYFMDMTDEKSMEKAVNQIISKFGKIDVLVNNAGMGFVGAVEEASTDEIRIVLETNFFGALKLTQLVLPFMRKEKSGEIVQISSQAGINASPGFGIYNASKFALEGFSEALAKEVAPLGIKVRIVEPGPFRTNFAGNGLGLAKHIIDDYAETAGRLRHNLKAKDGQQDGSPKKGAEAIISLVNAGNSTLRFPLGKIALRLIENKINMVKSDLEVNISLSESTSF